MKRMTNIEFKNANFTILFGCDPKEGVTADTQFVNAFFDHISASFDPKTGRVMFPECLNLIESDDVAFESVTNNLGRTLTLTRQSNLIDYKLLVIISDQRDEDGKLK